MRFGSWDSAVGIVTGYGLDSGGVRVQFPVGARFFSTSCCPEQFRGHPPSCAMGTGGFFPGGKAARS
jgi:hypothetical protein